MPQSIKTQTSTSRSSGFTIIEVLIVLAISGLILSLVLLAIPAINRNSRNSQRKNEVSTILSAVSQYELNNSANFPPDIAALNVQTPFYGPSGVVMHGQPAGSVAATVGPSASPDKVDVYNYAICDPDNPGKAYSKGADYSNIVAIFAVETATSTGPQCQQL